MARGQAGLEISKEMKYEYGESRICGQEIKPDRLTKDADKIICCRGMVDQSSLNLVDRPSVLSKRDRMLRRDVGLRTEILCNDNYEKCILSFDCPLRW